MPEKQTIRQVNEIEYILTRKHVKNINMRVYADGKICVSANNRVSLKDIDAFVSKNKDYINKVRKKAESRPEIHFIPNEFKNGSEFYFLGKKRVIAGIDNGETYLSGNVLYLPASDSNKMQKLFTEWLKGQAEHILMKYVDKVYSEFKIYKVPYPQITIRTMKSRWGSCMPTKNKITLNLLLLATPPECIYYVVVHEFAHFIYPNHSPMFWSLVARFIPDYKDKRKTLKQYSTL